MASRTVMLATWLIAFAGSLPAPAEVAIIPAARDATLIENAAGERANGSGPAFFVGRNNAEVGSVRRGLIAFDVTGALPPGAWVTRVELELTLNPSNPDVFDLALHRVLSPWSEGPSSASGGGGARAEPGDATWLHTHFDQELWDQAGGDFDAAPSASATVGAPGIVVWESTPELVADVQEWLDLPDANHGWILIGGEYERQTAKSFASREDPAEEARPRLLVEYEASCEALDLGRGALGLCRAFCETLACEGPLPLGSVTACDRLARAFARRTGEAPPCIRPDPR